MDLFSDARPVGLRNVGDQNGDGREDLVVTRQYTMKWEAPLPLGKSSIKQTEYDCHERVKFRFLVPDPDYPEARWPIDSYQQSYCHVTDQFVYYQQPDGRYDWHDPLYHLQRVIHGERLFTAEQVEPDRMFQGKVVPGRLTIFTLPNNPEVDGHWVRKEEITPVSKLSRQKVTP
ncbi:MAG: hypothetical protein HY539_06320 [Deltaproteobacteria bacterium]|nr:hypothetical protein [Deltaproteobacteria bacterium]